MPGPRANLEFAHTVAELGDRALFRRYVSLTPERAPTNSPQEFLTLCGVLGLGRLLTAGHAEVLPILRRCASDPRWRIREGVAMALQRLGERDMATLLWTVTGWSRGTLLERRAAAAALCEPKLLHSAAHARRVLQILNAITASAVRGRDRTGNDFHTLRKALGYCWSVAVAALPLEGCA